MVDLSKFLYFQISSVKSLLNFGFQFQRFVQKFFVIFKINIQSNYRLMQEQKEDLQTTNQNFFIAKYNSQDDSLYLAHHFEGQLVEGICLIKCIQSFLPKIKVLNLNNNKIGDKFCEIFKSEKWPYLQLLSLGSNQITAKGVKWIVKIEMNKIKKINLQFNRVRSEGLRILMKGNWPQLEQLWIQDNYIDSEGMYQLSNARWPKMKILAISDYRITYWGIYGLASSQLRKLQKWYLCKNIQNKTVFKCRLRGCQNFKQGLDITTLYTQDGMIDIKVGNLQKYHKKY